jgi:outer membrane protein assembly factor BamB
VTDRSHSSSSTRRRFLAAGLTGLGVGLAGCTSSCPDSEPPEPSTELRLGTASAATETRLPEQRHDWPQYRFDAGHTGFGDGNTAPSGELRVAWSRRLQTESTSAAASPPVLADGTLYVGSDDGAVTAFDAATGTVEWTTERVATNVAPAVAGESVYVHDTDGVVSLARDDGSVEWRTPLSIPVAAPTVHKDVVVASAERGVVAFARETGTEQWAAVASTDAGPPAVFGSSVVLGRRDVSALDLEDGSERWRAGLGYGVSAPVAGESGVYVGSSDGLQALTHDGEGRWRYERQTGGFGAPVLTDDLAYAVEKPPEGPSAVFALDRASGEPAPRWCSRLGEGVVQAATADTVLVTTNDGRTLQQFSPQFGEAGWQLRASGRIRPPALGTDAVFVTTDRGRVVALTGVVDA